MTEKPYLTLALVAEMDDDTLRLGPLAQVSDPLIRAAIRTGKFAEVTVPFETEKAVYGFIVTIINKPTDEPALKESLLLSKIAAQLYADYGFLARPSGTAAADDPLDDEAALAMLARIYRANPTIRLNIFARDLHTVIALVQLAARVPLPPDHPFQEFAREFVSICARLLSEATDEPALVDYIEKGWDPIHPSFAGDLDPDEMRFLIGCVSTFCLERGPGSFEIGAKIMAKLGLGDEFKIMAHEFLSTRRSRPVRKPRRPN
ncbi:MAG: hypothetical protein L6R45_10415 [Anaerolineae bacterium]|nr:hypothetical protein [Anaerolineae bacterium]